MNKPKTALFGSILLLYALYGLSMGEIYFIADGDFYTFDRYEDFTEFWITSSLIFYFGAKSIKVFFDDKKTEDRTPLTFENIEELNNFKLAKKSLRSAPYIYLIVGFFFSFPFGYLSAFTLNVDITNLDNCIKCQANGDWWTLSFFSSMIILPAIFSKLSFKVKCRHYIKNGIVTEKNISKITLELNKNISSH